MFHLNVHDHSVHGMIYIMHVKINEALEKEKPENEEDANKIIKKTIENELREIIAYNIPFNKNKTQEEVCFGVLCSVIGSYLSFFSSLKMCTEINPEKIKHVGFKNETSH